VEAAGYVARLDRIGGEEATAEEPSFADRHLADIERRLAVATVLTLPILLGLVRMTLALGLPSLLHEPVVPAGPGHAGPVLRWLALLSGRRQRAPPPHDRYEHPRGRRDERRLRL
jgi:hypothetical protein